MEKDEETKMKETIIKSLKEIVNDYFSQSDIKSQHFIHNLMHQINFQ